MQRKKIFLAHNSCLNSSYDLNVLRAGLTKGDFEVVDQPEMADEVIFSGCSVREVWVADAINQIDQIHKRAPHTKITVTGCIANVSAGMVATRSVVRELTFQSQQSILKSYTGLDFDAIDREEPQDTSLNYEGERSNGLTQLRQRIGGGKAAVVASLQEIDREFGSNIESMYRRTTKGFVFYNETEAAELITVTRSCLYKCSFCSIPRARGPFVSVPLQDILLKANAALARGIRHLILVGDEIGNYGADDADRAGGIFPDLLQALVQLDKGLRLSIRYIEPKPFLKNSELLLDLCTSGKIELLYVSLQSGSQRILDSMNRNYNIERVSSLLSTFKSSTDTVFYCNWMVGFPGETEEDFQQTVSLVKAQNFHINVAIPFSVRPDTAAEHLIGKIDEDTVDLPGFLRPLSSSNNGAG
jgi:tRNA-2-methylthio-N6-dimethylallyladenosine synthase